MDISLTWQDLTKLAANGKVEKDGNTISLGRPVLPYLEVSPDGLKGYVPFTVDKRTRDRRGDQDGQISHWVTMEEQWRPAEAEE